MMSALLRCPSRPCDKDDTGISTKNMSPSLSVIYKGYKECTFGPLASIRFPLWSVHPSDENPARCREDPSLGVDREAEPPEFWTGRIRSWHKL